MTTGFDEVGTKGPDRHRPKSGALVATVKEDEERLEEMRREQEDEEPSLKSYPGTGGERRVRR
ncbi:MAG: hypothetical protein IPP07_29385 [Holophagales bacterium]|nr:hypothetical protein [Holophagales bacterium]MBK9968752.1 hypothetical protein [Holophagales bacterium]